MHVVLGRTPVRMFPTTVKSLYLHTLVQARAVRLGNLSVTVVSPERLILPCLEAYREKDQNRIRSLLPEADTEVVVGLLKEFDDDGTLTARLQTLR